MESGSRYRKGLWTEEEDRILLDYVKANGRGRWSRIPRITGLRRCGKSCRLRWMNYLCPNVKKGDFSEEEDDLIIRLHKLLGNRWSLIAGRVPGRTDNQVKNHWNTHLCKKLGVKRICGKMSGDCISSTSTLINLAQIQPRQQNLLQASNDEHVLTVASEDSTDAHEKPTLLDIPNPIDSTSFSFDGRGFFDFVEEIPMDILWQEMGCFD